MPVDPLHSGLAASAAAKTAKARTAKASENVASFASLHSLALKAATAKTATTKATTGKTTASETTEDAAPKKPKNERSTPVEGRGYADILNGPRNGMFINTSGNERDGEAFVMVKRNDRQFHIYGTGRDRDVFEVDANPASARTPAAGTPSSGTTGTNGTPSTGNGGTAG